MTEIGVVEAAEGRPSAPDSETVAARIEAAGATAVVGSVADLLDRSPAAVVAPGERSVLAMARRDPSTPVLPVAAGQGVRSVAGDDLADALAGVLADEYDVDERRLLSVAAGGERVGRAALDVMLVTRDPAKISEYAIRCGDDRVARFRSDGVVLATPAGSSGYAAAAGGPVLAPGTGLAAVPVAPFATDADHWVLDPADGVELSVERDEGAVELLVDDERRRTIPPRTPVTLSVDGTVPILVGPESRSVWD